MSEALLVADSGPLIALARLGLLSLPAQLFREALVTATVWDEVSRGPHAAELQALNTAVQAGHLSVVSDPTDVFLQMTEPRIDAGERSAIALALSVGAAVLVDEKRGRAVAEGLGLHVLGTLGLLVRARDAGIVDRVRPLAEALLQGGYHLALPLVEHTLAAIGE
jgi:predicted nucleic acid-binding protein